MRKAYIDAAKGIGILLVMFSHLVSGSALWFAMPFYVGLFFVLAGYTYTQRGTTGEFVAGKARRLLVPYLSFNVLCLALYYVLRPLEANDTLGVLYSRYCLYPIPHIDNPIFLSCGNATTWFLTALFAALLLYRLLMSVSYRWQVTLTILYLAATFGSSLLPLLLPWSIDCAPLFALLIFAGYWLKENKRVLLHRVQERQAWEKWVYGTLLVLLYLLLAWANGYVNLSVRIFGRSLFLFFITCVAGSMLTLYLSRKIESTLVGRGLALIGKHSLTLFCLFPLLYSLIDKLLNLGGLSLYTSGTLALLLQTAAVALSALTGILCSVLLKRLTGGKYF